MHRKMRVQATSMAWSASSGMLQDNAGYDTDLLSFDCSLWVWVFGEGGGGGGGGGQRFNMMTGLN